MPHQPIKPYVLFGLPFGFGLVLLAFLFGSRLPPESRGVQELEQVLFGPTAQVAEMFGGGHEVATYVLVIAFDVMLACLIGAALLSVWTSSGVLSSGKP